MIKKLWKAFKRDCKSIIRSFSEMKLMSKVLLSLWLIVIILDIICIILQPSTCHHEIALMLIAMTNMTIILDSEYYNKKISSLEKRMLVIEQSIFATKEKSDYEK